MGNFPSTPECFRDALISAILNPIAAILFGAALLVFIWGIVEMLWALSEGGDTSQGKQHMFWGIIGLFIMTVAYGILQIATNTFGLTILTAACTQ